MKIEKSMQCIHYLLMALSAYFIASYLQYPFEPLIRIILFVLMILSAKKIAKEEKKLMEIACMGIFALVLSISMVLGYHIHVENAYSGTIENNYITPYSMMDLAALAFIFIGAFVLFFALYLLVRDIKSGQRKTELDLSRINVKYVAAVAVFIFLAWLPYLLAYWPGFVFGDSLASIRQALGIHDLVNNHPIFYTLFVKCCLKLGRMLGGGNTLGVAIYCLVQMAYMAMCFGYMICWIGQRGLLKKQWIMILAVIYGCTPYIATYSVAMWKDGFFASSIVVISLLLADFVFSHGRILKTDRRWLISLIFFMLVTMFSRNNGIYIIFFSLLSACVLYFFVNRKEERAVYRKLIGVIVLVLIFTKVVTGPVYDKMGWTYKKSAAYGVFLCQMARVVTHNGEMSEEEYEYMDSIFPIELYATTYRPCCVDLLKWDKQFNAEALNEGFFKHWFSMFLKNPRVYFEAWELQTYGFWTINCPDIMESEWNISGGVPRNTTPEYMAQLDPVDIQPDNLLKSDKAREILVQDEWSIPIGVVSFMLFLVVVYIILKKRWTMLLALAPSVGLFATLMIASPINYWPRYGVAMQLLIPVYVLVVLKEEQ